MPHSGPEIPDRNQIDSIDSVHDALEICVLVINNKIKGFNNYKTNRCHS